MHSGPHPPLPPPPFLASPNPSQARLVICHSLTLTKYFYKKKFPLTQKNIFFATPQYIFSETHHPTTCHQRWPAPRPPGMSKSRENKHVIGISRNNYYLMKKTINDINKKIKNKITNCFFFDFRCLHHVMHCNWW